MTDHRVSQAGQLSFFIFLITTLFLSACGSKREQTQVLDEPVASGYGQPLPPTLPPDAPATLDGIEGTNKDFNVTDGFSDFPLHSNVPAPLLEGYPEEELPEGMQPGDLPPGLTLLRLATLIAQGRSLLPNPNAIQPIRAEQFPNPQIITLLHCIVAKRFSYSIALRYEYLVALFLDQLGRFPDSATADPLLRMLTSVHSQTIREQVVKALLDLPEVRKRVLERMYYAILRRLPNAAEEEIGKQRLANLGKREEVARDLFASREYMVNARAHVGAWSIRVNRILKAFYRDIVGREATPGDLKRGRQQVAREGLNTATLRRIALNLMQSPPPALPLLPIAPGEWALISVGSKSNGPSAPPGSPPTAPAKLPTPPAPSLNGSGKKVAATFFPYVDITRHGQ